MYIHSSNVFESINWVAVGVPVIWEFEMFYMYIIMCFTAYIVLNRILKDDIDW